MFLLVSSVFVALIANAERGCDAPVPVVDWSDEDDADDRELDELFEVSLLQTRVTIVEPESKAHHVQHPDATNEETKVGSLHDNEKRFARGSHSTTASGRIAMESGGQEPILGRNQSGHSTFAANASDSQVVQYPTRTLGMVPKGGRLPDVLPDTRGSPMLPWSSVDGIPNLAARGATKLWKVVNAVARHVEQHHWTLLMVTCCLSLMMVIALSRQAAQKLGGADDCDSQFVPNFRQSKTMGPTVSFKEPIEYCTNPEECLHEDGLRAYSARKQSFRICDQCGSRWLFQKATCAYMPIAPRAAPADPE